MEYQVALQGDIYLLSKGSPLTTLQYPSFFKPGCMYWTI